MKLNLIQLFTLFLFQFSSAPMSAEELDSDDAHKQLIAAFVRDDLTKDQSRAFAMYAAFHYDEVLERVAILKYVAKPQYSKAQFTLALECLKQVDESRNFATHRDLMGLQFAWYLGVDQGKIEARPLIRRIDNSSDAYQAGLRQGDVITHAAGQTMAHPESVLIFRRLLHLWPSGQALSLKVVRNRHNFTDPNHRGVKDTIFTFSLPKKGKLKTEN